MWTVRPIYVQKWGKRMFTGEFRHTIDSKGRIAVPAKFRYDLGEKCVVSRYLDGCLAIYSSERWEKETNYLNSLNQNNSKIRKYVRDRFKNTDECNFDVQGRINIPTNLMEIAQLKKNVVFTGAGDHVELWDQDIYQQYNQSSSNEEMSEIVEDLPWNM